MTTTMMIDAWAALERGNRADADRHFRDACRLLDEPKVEEKLLPDAIPEWHHRLEARLLKEQLQKRLQP
jgi:hypothetical protein